MKQQLNPSPEEIALACLAIQSEWSEAERLKRLRCDLRPTVMTGDGRMVDVTATDYERHQVACDEGQEAVRALGSSGPI